jgi:hypothetical protein
VGLPADGYIEEGGAENPARQIAEGKTHVTRSFDISAEKYSELLSYAQSRVGPTDYNLWTNACSTFANEMYQKLGLTTPFLNAVGEFGNIDLSGPQWAPVLLSNYAQEFGQNAIIAATLGGALGLLIGPGLGAALFGALFAGLASPLLLFIDPLTLDLDGDGIELTALGTAGQAGASTVFFDFDGDGFRERTGWVKADDGMLALDRNNNGLIDDGSELFGQPARDGYEVLETYDTFQDGVIDARDAAFARLRIWRDLDQDGITDPGELKTLPESGITSISLTRTDVTGTNQGHDRGFQGGFTRANGTTGTAETIYFATDRRDTRADPTPGFTLAAGVDKLPQLPGSGQILCEMPR